MPGNSIVKLHFKKIYPVLRKTWDRASSMSEPKNTYRSRPSPKVTIYKVLIKDGQDRRRLVKNKKEPYDITIFGNVNNYLTRLLAHYMT